MAPFLDLLCGSLARRRLLCLGALAVAFMLLPSAVEAQEFQTCMSGRNVSGPYGPGQPLDATEPGTPGVLNSPGSMVQAARICAIEFANDVMVADYGLPIFYSFALIIVIWTGLQMMFGAQFNMGELINLAFLLGVPYAILSFYSTPAPFLGNLNFPEMVTGMGSAVAQRLVTGAMEAFTLTVMSVVDSFFKNLAITDTVTELREAASEAAASSDGTWYQKFWGGARAVVTAVANPIRTIVGPLLQLVVRFIMTIITAFFAAIILVLIIIPAIITYCSYLWGSVAMLVAIVIGPLFVPMILIPQLSFLFWGWFKTLLGASVHMMIAGAVFAVAVQLLTVPLRRLQGIFASLQDATVWAEHGIGTPMVLLEGFVLETIPIWLIAMLGAFKVGELTAMIMNSGPMPGAGLGDRLGQLSSAGRTAATAGKLMAGGGAAAGAAGVVAGVATGGVATAVAVASQATKAVTK